MTELELLLGRMEAELKLLDCWQGYPIGPAALMSVEPFCLDTMTLPQWLQFVFITRLKALIEGGLQLPSGSGVLPLAEEHFKGRKEALTVLTIIDAIDAELGRAQV